MKDIDYLALIEHLCGKFGRTDDISIIMLSRVIEQYLFPEYNCDQALDHNTSNRMQNSCQSTIKILIDLDLIERYKDKSTMIPAMRYKINLPD